MKILFHDVDGCLNTEDGAELPHREGTLSPHQIERLAELGRVLDQSPVDMMAINTGRGLIDTVPVADAINSVKLAYIIAEHGAVIQHTKTRTLLDWNATDSNPLAGIHDLIAWYYETGQKILSERLQRDVGHLDKLANLTIIVPKDLDSDTVYAQIQAFIENDSPFDHTDFVFHHSKGDGYVDIMSSIDKGDGLCFIKDLVEATDIQTISVGNGLNDMPMMMKTDLCLCPSNSEPELIEFCQSREHVISEHAYIDATINWLKNL